ncbi:MAG: HAMP domain-containing histidine kinase [Verrucomicrobiota bacterium]|nr:HAMP domain-containing histidine kinase [Verrucomicrobiota bacterium]
MDPLLDHAPCGYLAFNDEGIIRTVNRTLAALLNYSPEELAGQRFETLLTVGARIFYQTHFFPVLKLTGEAEEIYLTMRSRGGPDVPVLTNAIRRERDGEMRSECVFVRMLQRSKYEDELLHAKRTAEAARDAKAKFLSMMSHELRTPLQAIAGYCDLLLHEVSGPLNTEQRSDLRAVQGASEELVRLLNDILDFARLESGTTEIKLETVSVDAALARAETLVIPKLAEARLSYTRIGCDSDLSLRANADRLQQVLLNLLTNAIKFTAADGVISMECSADDRFTRIAVRDTGCGIPSEHLEHIFDAFAQVDPNRIDSRQRGVGLGLAISRELVEAMSGELSVESEVGAGSVFTIALPRAPAADAIAAADLSSRR